MIQELEKRGGINLNNLQANNTNQLYYIGPGNAILSADIDSEAGFILQNSGWQEIRLKEPRKDRYFLIRIPEGVPECDKNCDKCQHKHKCELGQALHSVMGGRKVNGPDLKIKELSHSDLPYYWSQAIS